MRLKVIGRQIHLTSKAPKKNMEITTRLLGKFENEEIHEISVSNSNDMMFRSNQYGARISSVFVKDSHEKLEEVTLAFQDLSDLVSDKNPYYGCIVGRYANRYCRRTCHHNNL